ncbi:MAG: aspartate kinase [Spirochaetaceae bacterium]|jgi:aspartate kinase|nr:aspartate kinase [Spirochaetaceae bacterium]
MIVMKFGGSSVANGERIRYVAEIVRQELKRKPVLVLSAMGDTTDHLLEAADAAATAGTISIDKIAGLHIKTIRELELSSEIQKVIDPLLEELRNLLLGIAMIKELTNRTKDYLVSFGERLSVRITAAYFNVLGIKAQAMDAWDAGFISDSNFSSAELLKESWDRIPQILNPLLEADVLPVITGFIAKDRDGKITTLGRGGSDRSATIIAAACKAEEAQVWKDVDGILTADPRIVPQARPVESATYEEAAELAYFGAQVLHPWAMRPCMKSGTPVLVKNSYNPNAPGTRILSSVRAENPSPVLAIASRRNVTLVDIVSTRMVGQSGFLEKVFAVFSKYGVSVDMVATSEVSISVTLDSVYNLEPLKPALTEIATVEVKTSRAIVTLIGDVRRSSELLQRAFQVCHQAGIQAQMVSQGASKVNISFIVNDTQAAEAVRGLHKEFFEGSI